MIRVATFGTFDLFHLGHLNIIERAKAQGDWLAVGISTDELNFSKKSAYPTYPYEHRARIVSALRAVDYVFPEVALEDKRKYLTEIQADILVMGDDWSGRFDDLKDIVEVMYLPRTPDISTTDALIAIRAGTRI